MYFKLPVNLPVSVIRATFDFYATAASGGRHHLLSAPVTDKSCLIDVPREATHLHAIRFHTLSDRFTYYYPEGGYPLHAGGFLPPLIRHAVGEPYAGGLVLQTGSACPGAPSEADLLPYKGTLIALDEQTATYPEGETHSHTLTLQTGIDWELPGLYELIHFHEHQAAINRMLLENGGKPLSAAPYWCHDNSVVELGISFHLGTAHCSIEKKTAPKQIRFIAHY